MNDKYYNKICPIRKPLEGEAFAFCLGSECAWFEKYAGGCAVSVIAGILADSTICQNSFNAGEELDR